MNEVARRNHSSRSLSNSLDCKAVVAAWRDVRSKVGNAGRCRSAALKHLNISESLCWGKGTIIFAPIRRTDHSLAVKCHFLPLLDNNVPFDAFHCTKKTEWLKKIINRKIMIGVESWVKGWTIGYPLGARFINGRRLSCEVCLHPAAFLC